MITARLRAVLLAPAILAGASVIPSGDGPADAARLVGAPADAAVHDHEAHDHAGGGHPGGHEADEGLPLQPSDDESVRPGGGCGRTDRIRSYDIVAIAVDITLNRYGYHDPQGRMFALASELQRIRAEEQRRSDGVSLGLQGDAIQPLVLRALPGECLRVELRNDLDEPASFHLHGSALVVDGRAATAAEPAATAAPGAAVTYEWRLPDDEPEGTHLFHSHALDREQSGHGLFGTLVVEPPGSSWHDPRTGGDVVGWDAVVVPPDGPAFREHVLAYHEIGDETYLLRRHDGDSPPLVDPLTRAYRPGTRAINYRSEPFLDRLELQQEHVGHHDESLAYSSYTFGDPATPVLRSYVGDRVKQRVVHAGGEVFHVHHVHGGSIRWPRQPGPGSQGDDRDDAGAILPGESERVDSQALGPSEAFDVEHECPAGGCQLGPGDYLVHCHVAQHYFAGMWGLWRVYNTLQQEGASTDDLPPLPPLPDREGDTAVAVTSDALGVQQRAIAERSLPAQGTPVDGDASVWDWQVEEGRVMGEPAASEEWPGHRPTNPGRRPPVLFDPATGIPAYPMLRPHLGARPPFAPGHGPAPVLDPVTADGRPPPPGANGVGALCPPGTRPRSLWLRAIQVPVPVDGDGGRVDPAGTIFVLAEDEARVRADPQLREPLAIRANAGEDCVDVLLTNEIRDGGNHPFSKVSAHIHFVRFDVQAGDGVSAGFNYEQTVRPFAIAGSTLAAPARDGATAISVDDVGRFPVGGLVGIGMDDGTELEMARVVGTEGTQLLLDRPLARSHPAGEAVSTEFVRYRWFPDAQVGTSYFHDHVNGLFTWAHGLVGALVVEPPGATYHDPRTGDQITSGAVADIRVPAGTPVSADVDGSFRELVVFLQDGNALTSVERSPGSAINLRTESLDRRGGRPEEAFSSRVHGDPATPMLEAYVGDPLVLRSTVSGTNEVHTLRVGGHWFRREPWSRRSLPTSTARVGISERVDLVLPAAGGPPRRPGDYLYANGRALKLREGAWGIIRVHPGPAGEHLQPLPGNGPTADAPPPVCPANASVRRFEVVATEVRLPMLFPKRGQAFVAAPKLAAVRAGTEPATPLVLRAGSGDCVEVQLRNDLPPGSAPVSIHPDGIAFDPADSGGLEVGTMPPQVVAVGETRTYTLYAHPELGEGVAVLRDGGDLARSGARGLYGAIVIGPAGVRYEDDTAWSTVAERDGRAWRDAVLFLHDEDDAIGTHRMPYTTSVRGAVGINYASGDDALPIEAYAGDPLRISVLAPYSEQLQVFSIEGHRWPVEPLQRDSTLVSSAAIGGWEAQVIVPLGGAGGHERLAGTYRVGNHREPYREAGQITSLVVHDPCDGGAEPLPHLAGVAARCDGGDAGGGDARRALAAALAAFAFGGVVLAARRRRPTPVG